MLSVKKSCCLRFVYITTYKTLGFFEGDVNGVSLHQTYWELGKSFEKKPGALRYLDKIVTGSGTLACVTLKNKVCNCYTLIETEVMTVTDSEIRQYPLHTLIGASVLNNFLVMTVFSMTTVPRFSYVSIAFS